MVAIDRDHTGVGRLQDGAGVTASSEGCIDIDAAVARAEPAHNGIEQNRDVLCTRRHRIIASDGHSAAPPRKLVGGPKKRRMKPAAASRPKTRVCDVLGKHM